MIDPGTGNLPSAKHLICNEVVVHEHHALTEGQLINDFTLQHVPDVKVGVAVVGMNVVRILIVLPTAAASPSG